jgi:CRP-like cAMP-binding protein
VRAKSDVRCLAIGANDFKQLLQDEPQIALAMLPVVAERLWHARSDA